MTWQEIVFSISSVVFIVTLWPTMWDQRARVPRLTSIPIALILLPHAVAYASLDLPWPAVLALLASVCWAFIAIKRSSWKVPMKRLKKEIIKRLSKIGFDHPCALVKMENEDGGHRTDLHVFDLDIPRHEIVNDLIKMMFDLEEAGIVRDFLVFPHVPTLDSESRAHILKSASVVIPRAAFKP